MSDKVYLEKEFLIIKSSFLTEKIKISSIEDIIILHHRGWNEHRIFMFLNEPIQYGLANNFFFNKIFNQVLLLSKPSKYKIQEAYNDELIVDMFRILKQHLPTLQEPTELDSSHIWKSIDEGVHFHKTKLVYSRESLSLKKIMIKHKILNPN